MPDDAKKNPFGTPRPPARGGIEVDPEFRKLRRYLAYALIQADAHYRHKLMAYDVLARDPLIGVDHPAYAQIVQEDPKGWELRPYLIEAALGRKLVPGETTAEALATLRRMMTEGNG